MGRKKHSLDHVDNQQVYTFTTPPNEIFIDITQTSDYLGSIIETNLQCTILCSWPGPPHKRQKRDVPGSALAHELLYDVARGEPWLFTKVDH